MKKTTKGALAAVAGGSLLLGGAGSLAYWTGDSTVTGDSISSGTLDMSAPDCADDAVAGTHGWQFDNTNAGFDPANDEIVPGDTLTKVCDITLNLVGSHIGATLAFDTAAWGAGSATGLTDELVPDVQFTVDGNPYAPITAAGTYVIRAAISVDFPYGVEDNDSNSPLAGPALQAILDDIVVTATQTHDNA